MVAGLRRVLRSGRARRRWLTGAVAALALLVGGLAVLTWPAQRSGSGGSAVSVAPAPGAAEAGGARGAPDRSAAAAPQSSIGPQTGDAGGSVPQQFPGAPVGVGQRQLVRSAQLTVDVDESAAATRQVRTTAIAAGGLVVEEQTGERGAWLVLKVPADTLDRVIDDIAAIGHVTARTSQVTDHTDEAVDLDARVASQQASVARVRALLAQATSIGDVVAIESELARREADLDSLQRRLATLKDRVALSTLTVELRSAPAPAPVTPAPGFGAGLGAGWAGLTVIGAGLATAAGFLLPFLPLLAIAGGVVWMVRRRRARVRRGGPGPEGGV